MKVTKSWLSASFRSISVTLSAVAVCAARMNAFAGETVQQQPAPAGHTIWRISQPNVQQRRVDYPQIVFTPGHTVTVSALGCVQTGGHGSTWKRYVDPAGANADRLYFGTLLIPGIMTSLQRFNPRQPTVYTIPSNAVIPVGQNHLALGYTDDVYHDNGYYSRNSDNGNSNQCWGLGNAQITIDIGPLPPPVAPPAKARYTFTIKNVEIRNLRSRNSDTDVLAANVMVDGTPSAVAKQSVGDWRQGPHNISFPILIDEVIPGDRVAVNYSIVNAGHISSVNQLDDALVSILGKIGGIISPGNGPLIGAAAQAWGAVFNTADANCDGPVVADSVMATSADLAQWTESGPISRTLSFMGTDSARGCGSNSFYEVTYQIARADASGPQPYSLNVDLRSHQAKSGPNTVLLRTPAHR